MASAGFVGDGDGRPYTERADWTGCTEKRRTGDHVTGLGRTQRSAGSFELRVFIGIDPDTHRRRYRSMTVRANRAEADVILVHRPETL
jgi:hypothetical protein